MEIWINRTTLNVRGSSNYFLCENLAVLILKYCFYVVLCNVVGWTGRLFGSYNCNALNRWLIVICAKTKKQNLMFKIIFLISGCSCPPDPTCPPEQVLVVNLEDEGSCCPQKNCECPSRNDTLFCESPEKLKYTNHTCPQPYCICECPPILTNCTAKPGCQLKGTSVSRKTITYKSQYPVIKVWEPPP